MMMAELLYEHKRIGVIYLVEPLYSGIPVATIHAQLCERCFANIDASDICVKNVQLNTSYKTTSSRECKVIIMG